VALAREPLLAPLRARPLAMERILRRVCLMLNRRLETAYSVVFHAIVEREQTAG
jgi:hypothetical protein